MSKKTIDPLMEAEGYREDFLGPKLRVPLPKLSPENREQVAPVNGDSHGILRYRNYSIIQHATRRFPFFTAANIDGPAFVDLNRKDIFSSGRDQWRKDPRLEGQFQWGQELYSAQLSHFDRGHMTRREDVQWGADPEEARLAAQSTFYFTNSVPQHPDLNRAIWSNLEDYILHQETVENRLRINLFTGPVLRDDDPLFVTPVRGEKPQLPVLFWKILFFPLPDGSLAKVGFLIGQHDLLKQDNIIEPAPSTRSLLAPEMPEEIHFLNFKEADTYQVKVSLIEKLTGLRFPKATDPLRRRRSVRLTLEQVEAPDGSRGGLLGEPQTVIKGLVLA